MEVTKGHGERSDGELLFNEYKVSIQDDEIDLKMDIGDVCATL